MARKIVNAAKPSLYGQPQVSFRPADFNAALYSHGYDILLVDKENLYYRRTVKLEAKNESPIIV